MLSFGADAFPENVAEWNETIRSFKDQPALFFQIAHDSEFLLGQALKRTAYSGCLLFDSNQAHQRNFKFPNLPKTVVVDQSGHIAGYTTYYPDEQAIQHVMNREVETGLNEEPPKPRPLFPDAARDIPPSPDVHIWRAAKGERRMMDYTPEPDVQMTKNQPLKFIVMDLWETPLARMSLLENLDQGNYDVVARVPAADGELLRTLVREAVEKRFGLRIETETRTVRAYVMTALRSSPQLQPSSPQDRNMTGQ